jgi:hypothetical protein
MNKHLRIEETLFMDKLRRLSKPIAYVVALGVLTLSVHLPPAQAAIVGTEAVVSAQQAAQDRSRVQDMLNRVEVKQQFLRAGVEPSHVTARVDALSDDEVHQLAGKMDQLPVGGSDALGILLFVFIVLLITDILGLTDIFPFVKKPSRR